MCSLRSSSFLAHPRVPLALACFALCTLAARGQTARLNGTITDPTGRVVPGASISITNEATGVKRSVSSTESGTYEAPALLPGSYTLKVEREGFSTAQQKGVQLVVDTLTRVNMTLTVGAVDTTVQVVDQPLLLQPNTAELATSIGSKEYDELPLVQQGRIRSPAAFVYLAPGVQGGVRLSGAENTSATNQLQVNGSQTQVTELLLEGLSAGKQRTPGSFNESAPPVDAVREFKITTTLLPADYGHTGAAVGSFSIKSGTNRLHGSLYEYLRNTVLNATPRGSAINPATHQNEFGVTAGGPITIPSLYNGQNRSFFFFSYGGSRKSGVDALQLQTVPSAARVTGDFSGGQPIYDPATTRLDPATQRFIRDRFPNNMIPANRMDRVGRAIAALYPNVAASGANNYSAYSGEKLLNPDIFSAKVDHQLFEHQHLGLTLVTTNIPRLRVDVALPDPLTSGIRQTAIAKTARVNHDWILAANKLNSLALGYNRFVDLQEPAVSYAEQLQKLGLTGVSNGLFPIITFTNGYSTTGFNSAQRSVENSYQLKDTFSWSLSKHSLRSGVEFRRTQLNDIVPRFSQGTLGFSNRETADPNSLGSTGDAFASLLLGQVDTGRVQDPFQLSTRRSYGGVFAQDDWKATRLLTLNLGVRWEYQTVPSETANRSSIVSLTTPNAAAGNLPGALVFAGSGANRTGSSSLTRNDFSAVSGRVGFAYQVQPTTVVRGGYGLYYSDNELSLVGNGFQPQASFTTTNNGVTPAFLLQNGFPQNVSLQPTLSPALINGQAATYYQNSAATLPRLQEWSLSVQQALGEKWLVEVDYVGNHGSRLVNPQMANINQVDPRYLSLGALLTQSATSSAAAAAGIRVPYAGFSGSVAQALRAYPQYQTLTSQSAKEGASIYHALQALLRRQFGNGLTLNLNYTYSKNMGYSSPSYQGFDSVDNTLQDAFNPAAEWSLLPNDVRHAVVFNYVYALPFGRSQKFLNRGGVLDGVVGGWSITGVHRYQSGFPLPIVATNTLPIFNRVLRPNKIAGVDAATHISAGSYVPGVSRIINPNAFSQPAAYAFGNARPTYDDLTSFPVLTEDLAVVKHVQLGERANWELYGQFFNALNRHRYTLIDTNFNNASFGRASSVSQPRYIQVGTRIRF